MLSWSFRVSLTGIRVSPLRESTPNTTASPPPAPPPPSKETIDGSHLTDANAISHFWNQFLDDAQKLPVSAAGGRAPDSVWSPSLHFCFDGMEKEVALAVQRRESTADAATASTAPSTSRPSFASSLSEHSGYREYAAPAPESLVAYSENDTFFSYAICADSVTELAQSLASRWAAVHVLLRRTKVEKRYRLDDNDDDVSFVRPASLLAAETSESEEEMGDHEVVVLASATVSLLDLAISEDDCFFFKIFTTDTTTTTTTTPAQDATALQEANTPADHRRSRHRRTQLRGQVSLTLRMDEETVVSVRPRLARLHGELPASEYHLRYGWCANEALALGTREKRAQVSSSRETSPSRPSDHASSEFLAAGSVEACATFKPDQLPTLHLTCSKVALTHQKMFFEVLSSGTRGDDQFTPLNECVARGELAFERFLVAARHDSEIEVAFTVACGAPPGSTEGPHAGDRSTIEGVLQISDIPSVRYALKHAAVALHQAQKRAAAAPGAVKADAGNCKEVPAGQLEVATSVPSIIAATATADGAAAPETNQHVSSGKECNIPHEDTRPPVAESQASAQHSDVHSAASSSADGGGPLMTPPQSLRNYTEHLPLSQAPFSSLSLVASPFPFTVLAPSPISPNAPHKRSLGAPTAASSSPSPLPQPPLMRKPATNPIEDDVSSAGGAPRDLRGHHADAIEHGGSDDSDENQSHSRNLDNSRTSQPNPEVPPVKAVPETTAVADLRKPIEALARRAEEPVVVQALRLSDSTNQSESTPAFTTDVLSPGEPSVSLAPRETPHAPSALELKRPKSLRALFTASGTRTGSVSQEARSLNQQRVDAERSPTSGGADLSGGSDADETAAGISGGILDFSSRGRSDALQNSALNPPNLHSRTVSAAEYTGAMLQSDSPPLQPVSTARGRDSAVPRPPTSEAGSRGSPFQRRSPTGAGGASYYGGGAGGGSGGGGVGSNSSVPSTISRIEAEAPPLPVPRRPTVSTTLTTTTTTATTATTLSNTDTQNLPSASSFLNNSKELPPQEQTDVAVTKKSTVMPAGEMKKHALPPLKIDSVTRREDAIAKDSPRPPPQHAASAKPVDEAVERSSVRRSRSIDPALILHFDSPSGNDDDDDDGEVAAGASCDAAAAADGLDVVHRGVPETEKREGVRSSVPSRQSSLPGTPSAAPSLTPTTRSSVAKRRLHTPRSATPLQLSPAPPPSLAPPRPEPAPTPLLNDAQRRSATAAVAKSEAETERHFATSLQLSAQYRTLLTVYKHKLSRLQAAETRAEAASDKLQAIETEWNGEGVRGEANGDTLPQASAIRVLHAQQDKERAEKRAEDMRGRTSALRQRLTNRQAAWSTAEAQLRSRDDALAATEDELKSLLEQMKREREELPVLPTPPSATNRRGSSSARSRDTAAALDAAAIAAQQHTELAAREAEMRAVLSSASVPTPPRLPPSPARPLNASGSRGGASMISSSVSASEPRLNILASAGSPNPRRPEIQGHTASHRPVPATNLFSVSTLTRVQEQTAPTAEAAANVASDALRRTPFNEAKNTEASLHPPSNRYILRLPSPSPSLPLPSGLADPQQIHTRYSPPSPSRTINDIAALQTVSPLSRLEQEALLDGIDKGDRPLVMHLLHTKPNMFYANNNLLHVACAATLPDVGIVETLLRVRPELTQGVDANTGNSVLHVACAARHPSEEIVKRLIVSGVNTQLRNKKGLSAFHLAVLNRGDVPRNRIKDALLTLGDCSVNDRTIDGRTPLHLVCDSDENLPAALYLLFRGADIEAHAQCRDPATGKLLSLTPSQLSRACQADQMAECIEREGTASMLRCEETY